MEIVREQTGQAGCSKKIRPARPRAVETGGVPLGHVADSVSKLAGFSILLQAGDAVCDRILRQISCGMNVQLLHDTGLMEFHRFHRHVEDRGDILRASALGDEL
jgi:hypothetical protein